MEDSKLRTVSISNKSLKKELLISSNQVNSLNMFLKDIMKNDVMIISTNIGLDVYYYAPISYHEIIFNTFLLIANCNNKSSKDYFVKVLNSEVEIKHATQYFFEKLLKNPLLLKSYAKSMSFQINSKSKENASIIKELLALWKEVLYKMNDDLGMQKLIPFLVHFQDSNLKENDNSIVQKLIQEALSTTRVN
jgi:uncharacterized protein (DUF2249 family)